MTQKTNRRGKKDLPFKQILHDLMATRGLTQAQIAALAGVSKTVVHDWTAGATPHDLEAVGRLSKALGMSLRELLLGEGEEPAAQAQSLLLDALLPTLGQLGSKGPDDTFEEESIIEGVYRISISKLRGKFQK